MTINDVFPTSVDAGGPYTSDSGVLVTLTGSAVCAPTDGCVFEWDLDNDGQYDNATGATATKTWFTIGNYTVGLRVTDDDGNFATDTALVTIRPVTHAITLSLGWNLVSFNLIPQDTLTADVLSSISGKYNLVYAWDATGGHSGGGNWMKYDPAQPFGNSLTNLNNSQGFWIRVTSLPAVLTVSGSQPETTSIDLLDNVGGWNLVGYPAATNRSLPGVLQDQGVGTDFSLIYAYHANEALDPWKLFDRGARLVK